MPVTWNMVPNGRDAIMGMDIPREDSVFETVVYRRYTANWRKPLGERAARQRGRAPHPWAR